VASGIAACVICGAAYFESHCLTTACHDKAAVMVDIGEGGANMVNTTSGAYAPPPSVGSGGTAVAVFPTTGAAAPGTARATSTAFYDARPYTGPYFE
jgi:hypothetical protein